ncbi:MAG: PAS domain-containing protein [Ewingella americana]|jgi:predicted transcriptional regulator YheO|uniref:helix-turn-helix transcriptional regulator n=1 Tax=Ewingella americana TaxID=41202 RepID=UPI0012AE814A|nr:PAS domain-containing protein [Ewingella americana]MCI1679480.1 PAS domain-containing protein [Ewingella americana]MCI1854807.1 PAS domain-containing protein [Ewingella americana]MCI1861910.1 PAS domain-containing protein [Ewingella americana]MCI2141615.1 PAS domain-containing protein [Ewingella americana]MCI2162117.1 PAS domain-containing protein [Ewingella americana]
MSGSSEKWLLDQLNAVAAGLGETFAPFAEVVLHDLRDPQHSIIAVHNNLSGRQVGEPTTEMGLARIASPDYPSLITNYANKFADGRPAKSTSIGIKDQQGKYIAALCINVDMTLFRGMQSALAQFTSIATDSVSETLGPAGTEAIRQYIDKFAARLASTPRALKTAERKLLMRELQENGLLEVKKSMDTVAQHLGVSRASIYLYAKE